MAAIITADLIAALKAPKRILGRPEWSVQPQKAELVAAIDGAAIGALTFRMRVCPDEPDHAIAAMLEILWQGKRRNFARFDWRGSEHGNLDQICPQGYWQVSAGNTHIHDPGLHSHIEIEYLFGKYRKLPVASQITPEPNEFANFLGVTADLFHIESVKGLPHPPWTTPSFNL